MRGYCPTCKEYRSDDGKDAWRIRWHNDLAICERWGSIVDVWVNKCENRSIQKMKDRKNCRPKARTTLKELRAKEDERLERLKGLKRKYSA